MKKLEWDSNFWGIDIFHLEKFDDLNLKEISSNKYLIQALPKVSNLKFINHLEKKEFNFKESKITLQKRIDSIYDLDKSNFKSLTVNDVEQYHDTFLVLFGKNSRFDIFPDVKVNKFYYTWVINSIAGKMDDRAIGYFLRNKLAGFVTYRINSSNITIGLLAVLPEFQGRSISQLLLTYVDNIAKEKNINDVRISTQGKNFNALNAYIKNGYRIQSIEHWYYKIKE